MGVETDTIWVESRISGILLKTSGVPLALLC